MQTVYYVTTLQTYKTTHTSKTFKLVIKSQ